MFIGRLNGLVCDTYITVMPLALLCVLNIEI